MNGRALVLQRPTVNANSLPSPRRSVSFNFSTRALIALAVAASLAACEGNKDKEKSQSAQPAAAQADAGAANTKPTVTVLVTSDENGWLLPDTESGTPKGGAAEMMAKWVNDEKHCEGSIAQDGSSPCNSATLVLSTGDHFNGPAISSFFSGESTAEVMNKMGYAASGLGNHEFDFGLEQFQANQRTGGFPYIASNVKVVGDEKKGLVLAPFKVFERHGAKIAVVALSAATAAKTTMSGVFAGLEVQPYEEALAAMIPQAWNAGADAVVVLADECPSALEPLVSKHPEWKISFLAGGHCHEPFDKKVGATPLIHPGRHFASYARAELAFDLSKPAQQRLTSADAKVVEVSGGQPNAAIAAIVNRWKTKTDKVLGEEIGFTKSGLKQDSPDLARWLAGSIRTELKADGAILNKKGVRQGLPAGAITKGSVYSVIPYTNSLMMVKVKGSDLVKDLENPSAMINGFTGGKGKWKDASRKPLDPKKDYSIVTIDYLYFGGDGFEFDKQDPEPTETGMVWQTPVIGWTKKAGSTQQKPLEKMLPQ